MNKILIALLVVSCSLFGNASADTISQNDNGANKISDVKKATYIVQPLGTALGRPFGSGILIDHNLMVTAWHVIAHAYVDVPQDEWHSIRLYIRQDATTIVSRAKLLSYDIGRDLAILETEGTACPCIKLFDESVSDEDLLYASYHLNGFSRPIFLRGYKIAQEPTYISTSIPVYFGASGGGLYLRSDGEFKLVGIIISMPLSANGQVLNYMSVAVPVHFVKRLLESE